MALHFTRREFQARLDRARAKMSEAGLDALLLFRQESMYYLTGYDTEGFVLFQTMVVGADGRLALLTRSADREQAAATSIVDDVRIWVDRAGANPGNDVRDMLASLKLGGKRIGVEYDSYCLTARRGKMLEQALDGFCTLADASDLVRLLRVVKSPAELVYVRKAGALADAALKQAVRKTRPGVFEGDIYAAMLAPILKGDGDPPASRWPMGSGEEALLVRYHTGHRTIGRRDQVTHEFAASYRHYHAALMATVLTGRAGKVHRAMFEGCRDALAAVKETLKPGRTVGDLFEAHAKALTAAGFGHAYLNACGYTMGSTFPPNWMDEPMIYRGNPLVLEPGMTFFTHMILVDREKRLTMSLGEQAIVTKGAAEPVTHAPRELVLN